MSVRSTAIMLRGLRHHVVRVGPASSRSGAEADPPQPVPLVLLHGFASGSFSWLKVMEGLGREREVVAFDRLGYGLSAKPLQGEWDARRWAGGSPYSASSQADLTAALIKKLGLPAAMLVGNSAGGTVAVLTALRHPGLVAGLILISPALLRRHALWLDVFLAPARLPLVGRLLSRAMFRLAPQLLEGAYGEGSHVTAQDVAAYRSLADHPRWDAVLSEFARTTKGHDLEPALPHLRLPALVIAGSEDAVVRPRDSRRAAHLLPGSEFMLMPGCGHMPQEEQPEAFLEVAVPFVEMVDLAAKGYSMS